jgi:hypothetical protein
MLFYYWGSCWKTDADFIFIYNYIFIYIYCLPLIIPQCIPACIGLSINVHFYLCHVIFLLPSPKLELVPFLTLAFSVPIHAERGAEAIQKRPVLLLWEKRHLCERWWLYLCSRPGRAVSRWCQGGGRHVQQDMFNTLLSWNIFLKFFFFFGQRVVNRIL